MITPLLASHHHVIHICRDIRVQLRPEDHSQYSVESATYVPEPLQHSNEAKCAEGCSETGLVFVALSHPDAMIFGKTIMHAHHL
jgi:hypothetical protein